MATAKELKYNSTDVIVEYAKKDSSGNTINCSVYENKNNKVTSWQSFPDNTHYPSEKLVKDSIDDIREIAAGKTKTLVCSINDTSVNTSNYTYYHRIDGTYFTSATELSNYISGLTNINARFNTQDNAVYFDYGNEYLLINNTGGEDGTQPNYTIIRGEDTHTFFSAGDTLYIVEITVPDRWVSSANGSWVSQVEFSVLETAKVPIVEADRGLSVVSSKVGHTNSVAAVTTAALKRIKYDEYGHITGTGTAYFSDLSSRGEAYLDWGGQSLSGNVTPVDGAIEPGIAGNKMAFANAASVVVDYSTDAGSTWTSYDADDNTRRGLVSTSSTFVLGKGSTTSYANNRLRITLNSNRAGGNCYTSLRKILIYLSTNGASGTKCVVSYRTIANYNNNVDTWTTLGTYSVSGWSGWNSIPFNTSFGGSSSQTSQTAQIRLTFTQTGGTNNMQVNQVKMIGITNWGSPSTMAGSGHLYSYDVGQNATFPAKITASQIVKSGGKATQFLKADGSLDSNTYLTSHQDISGLVSKSGDTMTGLLTTTTGVSHGGTKHGNTYITSIDGNLIFQNNSAIRFGGDSWDYNVWGGLKYTHSNKTVHLGIADGVAFTANSAQTDGTLNLANIKTININSGSAKIQYNSTDNSIEFIF